MRKKYPTKQSTGHARGHVPPTQPVNDIPAHTSIRTTKRTGLFMIGIDADVGVQSGFFLRLMRLCNCNINLYGLDLFSIPILITRGFICQVRDPKSAHTYSRVRSVSSMHAIKIPFAKL